MMPIETVRTNVRSERGFTLVEVLFAMAILTVGLLGLAGTVALQSGVASSATSGLAAVTRGHYVSTATLLAQEWLEQVKRLEYTLTSDKIGVPTPTGFEDQALGTITGLPNFSREMRVQADTPAANSKTITVTVKFTLPTDRGKNTESIAMSTIVAARP